MSLPEWLSVKTVIKVESERQLRYKTELSTRYYISDLTESAFEFYQRIRGAKSKAFPVVPQGATRGYRPCSLWERVQSTRCADALRGVENKVHYVRDVTQGEDKSRIRTKPLPQMKSDRT